MRQFILNRFLLFIILALMILFCYKVLRSDKIVTVSKELDSNVVSDMAGYEKGGLINSAIADEKKSDQINNLDQGQNVTDDVAKNEANKLDNNSYDSSDMKYSNSREDIENIIKDYLLKNPEILKDAFMVLQEREEQNANKHTENYVSKNLDKLENTDNAPFIGKEDASIKIVFFYDYNCGYCKRASNILEELVAQNNDVKVILRPVALLSSSSLAIARYSLIANKIFDDNNKFIKLHNQLIKMPPRDNTQILSVLKEHDLDQELVKKHYTEKTGFEYIDVNMKFAKNMHINGVPVYVINGKVFSGLHSLDNLVSIINKID